ncbi:MAG TPA: endolytic transglycosylase MltG, partial [Ktedonobacteraceae bacterium]
IIWARVRGLDTTLQAGVYTITPGTTIDGIIAKLQNAQPDHKNILLIDGWRLEQAATQASQAGLSGFNKQDFLNWTHHPDAFPDASKYPILKGRKSMEGLLFPDTYLVPVNYNTTQIIDMMLNEMQSAVAPLLPAAKTQGLDEYQLITLASIVQREASNAAQMPQIAGIYLNRLSRPTAETAGFMGSDPTVEYAYDSDHPPTGNAHYWGDLNNLGKGSAVETASLWNTYTHKGLPPTPISASNLHALTAAAHPKTTACYYFYTKPKTGDLVCEATYAQIQLDEQRDHLNQ